MEKQTAYIFIDTMVYLHYEPIDKLELPKLIGTDYIIVLIPEITIRELDKHKLEHNSNKIKQRSRDRLKSIRKWISEKKVTSKVSIQIISKRPNINFKEYELEKTWNDHQLLASLICYKNENDKKRIVLLTQDNGLFIKANGLNIEAIMMPEDKKLTEEDSVEKEIRKLTKELNRIKASIPKLILRFYGTTNEIDYKEFITHKSKIVFNKEKLIAKLRKEIPELNIVNQ